MGQYRDFIEAYQKAYPHVRRQLMYEQANKLWKDLKLDPHLWEGKYKMKMNKLKLLAIKNGSPDISPNTSGSATFWTFWESRVLT